MLLIQQSFLVSLLPFLLLFLPFGVNLACEGVLELKRSKIDKEDMSSQKRSGRSPIQETCPQETHRASPVHWRAGEVEWKTRYRLVHQDSKIVA